MQKIVKHSLGPRSIAVDVRKFWQLQSHRNNSTSPSLVVSSPDSVLIHWNLSEFTQVPNQKTDHLDPFVPMVCVLAPTKVLLLTTPIPMKMIPRWLGLRGPPRSTGHSPVETLGHGGTEPSSTLSHQIRSNCVTIQSGKWKVRAKTHTSVKFLNIVINGSKPPRIVLDAWMSTLAEFQRNKLTAWGWSMYSNFICNFPVCISWYWTSVKLFQVRHCSKTR